MTAYGFFNCFLTEKFRRSKSIDLQIIDHDGRGCLLTIFLISLRKRLLWVLIRCASPSEYSLEIIDEALLMSTPNRCFHGDIRNILVFFGLIWSYFKVHILAQ